jgi:hypothetical protein
VKVIRIISIYLLICNLAIVYGQTGEGKINVIRERFQIINQYESYETKKLINEQFLKQMTDGGGELTGYFKDGEISKIVERVGISFCIRIFEYYFWDGKLIFVYELEIDPLYNDSTGTLDWNNQKIVFEGRYYFDNDKLIESKIIGQKRLPDDIRLNKEKIFLAEAIRNRDLLLQ